MKKQRLPRDPSQRAKMIVDLATGEESPDDDKEESDSVRYGREGGKKGGAARAKKLTADQRREIAQKAAKARWGK